MTSCNCIHDINNTSIGFDDLSIPTVLLFNPSTYEIDVPVEVYVPDDSESSEERKEFSISVSVKAINATGTLTTLEGGPIEITVYDDDCECRHDCYSTLSQFFSKILLMASRPILL